jgi:hypothetical protein
MRQLNILKPAKVHNNLNIKKMKKVMQTYLHEGKQRGDCWRACIASILECDIDLFPSPNDIKNWVTLYTEVLARLKKMGYEYNSYSVAGITDKVLSSFDTDGYCIAIGKSPRSTHKRITHAVVWRNGIKHDPHPDCTGLLDITRFEIFTKIKP